eukprot:COSAG02_NODE_795_length_17133_cov_6.577727_28_plen_126_part_00
MACRPKLDEDTETEVPIIQPKVIKTTRRSSLEVAVEKAITYVSNSITEELQYLSGRDHTNKVEKHYSDGVITKLNYQRVMGDRWSAVSYNRAFQLRSLCRQYETVHPMGAVHLSERPRGGRLSRP